MPRRCFYCGNEATELEFGIPTWAPGIVGLDDLEIEHLITSAEPRPAPADPSPAEQLPFSVPAHSEISGDQPVERLHQTIELAIDERSRLGMDDYSVRSLCASCRKRVEGIDAEARPLVARMIDDDALRLDTGDSLSVATWAARAAYAVLAVERKSQGVPRAHRRSLLEGSGPHENVFVGCGRYRHHHLGVLAARQRTALDRSGSPVEAYNVLLVFGHLAVKVFGIHRRPQGVRVKPPEGEMTRVWPAQDGPVAWPPIWSLSQQTLEHAFLYEPFFRPYRYSEVAYLGPGKKIKAKRKRTEGLRGRN